MPQPHLGEGQWLSFGRRIAQLAVTSERYEWLSIHNAEAAEVERPPATLRAARFILDDFCNG